jgi:hypothetical protein
MAPRIRFGAATQRSGNDAQVSGGLLLSTGKEETKPPDIGRTWVRERTHSLSPSPMVKLLGVLAKQGLIFSRWQVSGSPLVPPNLESGAHEGILRVHGHHRQAALKYSVLVEASRDLYQNFNSRYHRPRRLQSISSKPYMFDTNDPIEGAIDRRNFRWGRTKAKSLKLRSTCSVPEMESRSALLFHDCMDCTPARSMRLQTS